MGKGGEGGREREGGRKVREKVREQEREQAGSLVSLYKDPGSMRSEPLP